MRQQSFMGLPYVPFTFPTVTVQTNAKNGGVDLSVSEVDELWGAYQNSQLKDGLKPFSHDMPGSDLVPLLDNLTAATSLSKMKVVAWLNATEQAVKQGFSAEYINPASAAKAEQGAISLNPIETVKTLASDAGTAIGNFIKPVADPVTNLVKWGAILVVGGAVVYGIYNFRKFQKLRKKRKA